MPSVAPPTPSPSPAAPLSLIVRGADFADGRSASPQRDISLGVRDGLVAYLGPRDGEPDPRGAEIVDGRGRTIVPGFVDGHAHLTGSGGRDYLRSLADPDELQLRRAEANARASVRGGVLAIRDLGAARDLGLRARDLLRGRHDAPLIVAAGTWIARRDTHVRVAVQVASGAELVAAARTQLDAGADIVKVVADDVAGRPTFSASELRGVVQLVHQRGRKVAAHAQGDGARVAAEAGVDTVEHGFAFGDSTAALMRGRTTLVTTLSVLPVLAAAPIESGLASVRAAHRAGVRIAAGTDFGGSPVLPGRMVTEIELLVRAGLEPHQALGAATWVGGEVMGHPDAGRLVVGGSADFLLVDGDPLVDPGALRRLVSVYRAGVAL